MNKMALILFALIIIIFSLIPLFGAIDKGLESTDGFYSKLLTAG